MKNINEFLVSNGSTSTLTREQKCELLQTVCENYGLNSSLLPFNFIAFNGQEKLYLTKNGCDQIANIRNLSRDIVAKDFDKDTLIYTITAKVSDSTRYETATACVFCGKFNAKGEINKLVGLELANKFMSVETKAKRRATLAFIGFPYEEDAVADYESSIKTAKISESEVVVEQPKQINNKSEVFDIIEQLNDSKDATLYTPTKNNKDATLYTPTKNNKDATLYTPTKNNKDLLARIYDELIPNWQENSLEKCKGIALSEEILKINIADLKAYVKSKL